MKTQDVSVDERSRQLKGRADLDDSHSLSSRSAL